MKKTLFLIPFLLFISCDKKQKVKYTEVKEDNKPFLAPVDSTSVKKDKSQSGVSCEVLFDRHGKCIFDIKSTKKLYNIPIGKSPKKGSESPIVRIVEFTDFQCPACQYMSTKIIPDILNKYGNDYQIVLKHFPLSFHPFAATAAEAAEAVRALKGEKAFWKFHDDIFTNQEKLSKEYIYKAAEKAGVDPAKFKEAMDKGTYKSIIKADIELGNKVNVDGTPTLFINGVKFEQGMDLEQLIKDSLEKAKALALSGTPRKKVYSFLVDHGKLIYETPVPEKVQQKQLASKKEFFMKRCKSSDPKLHAFVVLMRECTAKHMSCDAFSKCMEEKLRNSQ